MHHLPRTLFDRLPSTGVERGICTSNSPSVFKASAIKPLGLFAFGSLNGNVNLSAVGIVKLTWFQGEGAVK